MNSLDVNILGLKPKEKMKEQKYPFSRKNSIFTRARCSQD